jgi:hypothetical protein
VSDPLETVLTAARATKDATGTPVFEHVSGVAELPGKENYPALIVTLVDGQSGAQPERGTGLVAQEFTVTAILYETVERITDLDTETTSRQTWTDVRSMFAGFLYELWRGDPTDPNTGETSPQARAPNARLIRNQRSTRSVEGKKRYAIGFELEMSGAIKPAPLG